ncbi:predicted protein [Arabidopsis lyrata subsp. lyrata]|uniref:Predicted protein n=1 Tax=Arabidopsis lyrata subsp. lyrata TaxID=81972 RepID=D7KET7_ARALL|nr:predicted protein [Arabidopsis lyrata subsp. lyrata]
MTAAQTAYGTGYSIGAVVDWCCSPERSSNENAKAFSFAAAPRRIDAPIS